MGTGKILSYELILGTVQHLSCWELVSFFPTRGTLRLISYRELGGSYRFGKYEAQFVTDLTRTILSYLNMGHGKQYVLRKEPTYTIPIEHLRNCASRLVRDSMDSTRL